MKTILYTQKINVDLILVALLAFVQCAVISSFSQHAHIQIISLKVDALNVMGMAEEFSTLRTNSSACF
jgi:hypothetical protein